MGTYRFGVCVSNLYEASRHLRYIDDATSPGLWLAVADPSLGECQTGVEPKPTP